LKIINPGVAGTTIVERCSQLPDCQHTCLLRRAVSLSAFQVGVWPPSGHERKYVLTTWREELVDADTAVSGELVSLARAPRALYLSLSLSLSPARYFSLACARALSLSLSLSLLLPPSSENPVRSLRVFGNASPGILARSTMCPRARIAVKHSPCTLTLTQNLAPTTHIRITKRTLSYTLRIKRGPGENCTGIRKRVPMFQVCWVSWTTYAGSPSFREAVACACR